MKKMIFTLFATTMLAVTGFAQTANEARIDKVSKMDFRNAGLLYNFADKLTSIVNSKLGVFDVKFYDSAGNVAQIWYNPNGDGEDYLIDLLHLRIEIEAEPEWQSMLTGSSQISKIEVRIGNNKPIIENISLKESNEIKQTYKMLVAAEQKLVDGDPEYTYDYSGEIKILATMIKQVSNNDLRRLKSAAIYALGKLPLLGFNE